MEDKDGAAGKRRRGRAQRRFMVEGGDVEDWSERLGEEELNLIDIMPRRFIL